MSATAVGWVESWDFPFPKAETLSFSFRNYQRELGDSDIEAGGSNRRDCVHLGADPVGSDARVDLGQQQLWRWRGECAHRRWRRRDLERRRQAHHRAHAAHIPVSRERSHAQEQTTRRRYQGRVDGQRQAGHHESRQKKIPSIFLRRDQEGTGTADPQDICWRHCITVHYH